ncbi:MAG TPA: type II CAAX endopeptidase family protein [Arenimonas sp.]|uniref:CPBP family intramembrane glutamic endopeptidase n=1 Tax=Arenimonas sp. TaxID=1872635 RepID=UPI002BFE0323|nr:type II CAAX endopeptidase family protein [Arenimonas sp.]HMB56104.1 type II CAAX endopeptidase family protein [Arenimonas sp.]
MKTNDLTAATTPAKTPLWLRVLRNPLVRIILFSLLAIGLSYLSTVTSGIQRIVHDDYSRATPAQLLVWAVAVATPIILAYWLLVRGIEGRRVDELAWRKLLPHTALGLLTGFAIMIAAAGLMAVFGCYRITGVNADANLLGPLVLIAILPGITEEIIFRGVLYRVVEDGLGSWLAVLVSALFFGVVHLANPNATPWSAFAIALEAGLLLGMAYAWTRSLYFVIGLHAAWNFTQGAILGISVSGIEQKGLLVSTTQGSPWLSGGAFGAEGSVLTVIICTALGLFFTRKAIASGQIRAPFWNRSSAESMPPPATGKHI